MSEIGPTYNVELIDTLPLDPAKPDGFLQQMPSHSDLKQVSRTNQRVAAAYEVLLHHWRQQQAEIAKLKAVVKEICDELYGKGFEVSGWHLNGALEPLDSWFDNNGWCAAVEPTGEEASDANV